MLWCKIKGEGLGEGLVKGEGSLFTTMSIFISLETKIILHKN